MEETKDENTAREQTPLRWVYTFAMANGGSARFDVRLDPATLRLMNERPDPLPDWTLLPRHQCANCPLDPAAHRHCPVAANLAGVIARFAQILSFEETTVTIETEERTYSHRVPIQHALGSLVGIYMVTSGCPILDRLRPMVATHLPFATRRETTYRVLSMYLLAQFFAQRRGRQPDWSMRDLVRLYENIEVVNQGFARRISGLGLKDAVVNAVVCLNSFAQWAHLLLSEDMLEDIEVLFSSYVDPPTKPSAD